MLGLCFGVLNVVMFCVDVFCWIVDGVVVSGVVVKMLGV